MIFLYVLNIDCVDWTYFYKTQCTFYNVESIVGKM